MREWLIEIRKTAGLSQYAVADKSGMSQSYYAAIEIGKRGDKLPVETAMKIATALNFDWKMFYENIDTAAI